MMVMKATTAHTMTKKVIEAKRECMLKNMNARILNAIDSCKFECDFIIDSPALQDEFFDYFTSLGYAVHFSPISNSDSRFMTISWEDAIQ